MSKKKVIGWILFALWCGFILWMTLLNRTPYDHRVFRPDLFYEFRELLTFFANGLTHTMLFFENILLFIPFGFLIPWKKKWWVVLIIGCMFSTIIECLQYVTMLGECEIDDVIANTIGTIIGNELYLLLEKIKETNK